MTQKINVGNKAPLFILPDKNGRMVKLEDYLGKKIIVLYFYPKDESPGCTKEACFFRDRYELFLKHDAEVIGISSDDRQSHAAFTDKYDLPFILLSDVNDKVREKYDVGATLGLIPGRKTFVIDKKGIIRHQFSSQFNPKKHVDEAIRIITQLQKED
ncbi:MAG: peroxiredoxin [Asgard group archaeon]|nr:peroxiredoxin [Asgard group archaeon]